MGFTAEWTRRPASTLGSAGIDRDVIADCDIQGANNTNEMEFEALEVNR